MNKIVKKFVLAGVVSLVSTMAWSWSWINYNETLKDHRWIIKAGVGAGTVNVNLDYVKGSVNSFVMPIQGEFLFRKIPISASLEIRPLWYDKDYKDFFSITIMPGVNYHVDTGVKGLDLYAGIKMGLKYSVLKIDGVSDWI